MGSSRVQPTKQPPPTGDVKFIAEDAKMECEGKAEGKCASNMSIPQARGRRRRGSEGARACLPAHTCAPLINCAHTSQFLPAASALVLCRSPALA